MASRRRFALPAVLAGVIGLGAGMPALAAGSRPRLAPETPAQLIAAVLAHRSTPLSGGVAWTPDLGLPSLSSLQGGGQGLPAAGAFDPTSLLTTPQTFSVWVNGSEERIAASTSLAESDVLRVGSEVWLWNSATQHVTRLLVPTPGSPPSASPVDPQTLAAGFVRRLQAAGTDVSVGTPTYVAGVAAQVLQLSPADPATSTVSAVDIAVDPTNGAVLQVTVLAAGQARPALQVGFTWVRFAAPAQSVFAPPRGRTTTKILTSRGFVNATGHAGWYGYGPLTPTSALPGIASASPRLFGSGWSTVAEVGLPAGSPAAAALEAAATPVTGGRLLRSSLLDVAVLPGGHALVGFVPPAVLEADAASLAG